MSFEARPELTISHQFMVGSVQAFLPEAMHQAVYMDNSW